MKYSKNKKLCVTCRHFILVEEGREFENIADTQYQQYRCRCFGRKTKKEYFLMSLPQDTLAVQEETLCEFWEDWKEEDNNGLDIYTDSGHI